MVFIRWFKISFILIGTCITLAAGVFNGSRISVVLYRTVTSMMLLSAIVYGAEYYITKKHLLDLVWAKDGGEHGNVAVEQADEPVASAEKLEPQEDTASIDMVSEAAASDTNADVGIDDASALDDSNTEGAKFAPFTSDNFQHITPPGQ